jgi:pyruvate,water dikinase
VSTQWILEFEKINQESVRSAGTKCANLGELMRIGMPVPPGFVVTAQAFDFFLKATGADKEIDKRLKVFNELAGNIEDYEKLSQELSKIITSNDIPKELEEKMSKAYEALSTECNKKEVPVAVRSSGCAEDLPTAAFAGQYDSYLNVMGDHELFERVRDCWASLFTSRSISYRKKNKLPIKDQLMGVIVQKVVHSRSAGVAFTALPSTGNTTWVMIEGNWGTAESVVQGTVTPDRCYVNKKVLDIEEKNISQKLRQHVITTTGTCEEDVPEEKQSEPCFSDKEARKIAEMAKMVESHYGRPQDIEWAIETDLPYPDNIFLVQTRPITTLQKKSAVDQIADLMVTRFVRR